MPQLYHVYNRVNHEAIRTGGLQGVDWPQRHEEWELPLSPADARDIPLPDGADDRFEVGRAIAEYVFEDERPDSVPSRAGTVFFYADRDYALDNLDADYNVAVVDADGLDNLVCGDDEWKTHVMSRTIACVRGESVHITESHLRGAARRYWDGVENWPLESPASVRLEVFGQTRIPPSEIDELIDEA